MKGTFKPGDKLIIEKIPFKQIRKGDLIIFDKTTEEKSDFVVHRVVDISPNGLITRGDNCCGNDKGWVTEMSVTGRVIGFDRLGKILYPWNGRFGMFRARGLQGKLHLAYLIKRLFRKPYLMLRKSGFIKNLWHPEIEVIHFQSQDDPLDKFVHHGRTVAIFWKTKNRWWIKKPYDFIMQSASKL